MSGFISIEDFVYIIVLIELMIMFIWEFNGGWRFYLYGGCVIDVVMLNVDMMYIEYNSIIVVEED